MPLHLARVDGRDKTFVETINWTNLTVKLGDLKPWEHNPKSISKAHAKRLLASWEKFGQFQTVAIGPDCEVYDGHQRLSVLRAAHGDGFEVAARQSSRALDDSERRQLVIEAHAGTTGQFDWDALANWDAVELQEWGLDAELLKDWKAGIGAVTELIDSTQPEPPEDPGAQIDRAEELREKWGVESGQLWKLGEHRIICGDCTDRAVVERVMGGERASLMITDPPYGVDYHGNFIQSGKILSSEERIWQDGIENDENEFFDTIKNAFTLVTEYLNPGAACLVCAPAGRKLKDFMNLWPDNWHFQAALVWNKQSLIISRWDYHPQHEMILYGWVDGARHNWYGGTKQSTVWDIPRHQGSGYEHPTEKPIQLYDKGVENHSVNGEIIIEPFSGSGTSIIACERLSRKCRAVEISPGYVAVSIQRWVDMTGGVPELITGE